MQFRKDINGLRAIAVIAVVLFHFNASWMPGGFAGVDVFFVISGFLMTGIIFNGIEKNDFSILKFYISRANRIIPALAVLCLTLIIFGWFYLTPLDFKSLGKHALSSISFLSNIIYWRESGYFDAISHEKWLLHTWSLSVEWQFYLAYPLILVGMHKYISKQKMKETILILTIIGFIFCIISTYAWPNASYYLLSTRAWEMMIGGVAYLYPIKIKGPKKQALELLGITLILCSYLFISKDSPWPGYLAIFPVLGSFLVIQAQHNNSLITGNVIFQKIGAWSYSIYLWHWPIVVAIYYYSLDKNFIFIGIFASVLLGFFSHKYIEKIKFRNNFTGFLSYGTCKPIYITLFLGIISGGIYMTNGINIKERLGASTPQAKFLNLYEEAHRNLDETYWLKCNTYSSLTNNNTLDVDPSCINEKGQKGVYLWGDSHAEALSFGIRSILTPLNIPFYQKTSAGCKASLKNTDELTGVFKEACDSSNKVALESISNLKPKLVIIAQANGHNNSDWEGISETLKDLGVEKVLLVGPIQQWKPSLPKVMIKTKNWNNDSKFVNDDGLDMSIIAIDSELSKKAFPTNIIYLSLIDNLCVKKINSFFCRVKVDNEVLIQVDYGHLSKEGSLFIAEKILSSKIKALYKKTE
ncbi:acyltransferase family protein [Shewanella sp. HL-SH8]|uniref:acyltransferase family protein n=1 Tax=Shewanella sp. HL-SH8 TaxID=3436242 RepID=UPI003EB8421D